MLSARVGFLKLRDFRSFHREKLEIKPKIEQESKVNMLLNKILICRDRQETKYLNCNDVKEDDDG